MPDQRPIAWTIAGSDSGGGAGIQADLKTINALGVHACSVITAITAQNTLGVAAVSHVDPGMIESQLMALQKDLVPTAVKIGMLGAKAAVSVVSEYLKTARPFTVCDPVMAATRGGILLDADAGGILRDKLFPRVNLLTPNIPEAVQLTGRPLTAEFDIAEAAKELLSFGVQSVLIKGGHFGGEYCQDFWTSGSESAWLTSPRQLVSHTHGGGCTLSAAIVAGIARGMSELDAIVLAKAYTNQGLRHGGRVGHGRGPLAHLGWPSDPADLPWITRTAGEGVNRPMFPDCGSEPLGLYPIVDRADWVARLVALGVKTIQLRIKDMDGALLEKDIARAIEAARTFGSRLFINDHWELALKHGAYGVHIGQDDLPHTDLRAIERAGCRLGVSTHGYAEIARALSVRPSYIAIGTVFPSPSKTFSHAALGLDAFARMRKLLDLPVVAIGGITLERAPAVWAAGADGIAVISDVTKARDVESRVAAWLSAAAANSAC